MKRCRPLSSPWMSRRRPRIAPLIGRAHLERGVALFVLGRTPEAAEILQLAITCLRPRVVAS
jgi:hypothetical protein